MKTNPLIITSHYGRTLVVTNAVNDKNSKNSERNLERWAKESGENVSHCSVEFCPNKDHFNGSHVSVLLGKKERLFILPLCDVHNDKRGEKLSIDYYNTYLMGPVR